MTLIEFFATGKYRDFFLLDGQVFPLPLGFTIDPSPIEASNIKTMASGLKRRDLIRRGYKYKFTWSVATQPMLNEALAIAESGVTADSLKLYLKKQDPASASDYQVITLSLVGAVGYKPKTRPRGLFIYESVSMEAE